jgi:hypothetical protein
VANEDRTTTPSDDGAPPPGTFERPSRGGTVPSDNTTWEGEGEFTDPFTTPAIFMVEPSTTEVRCFAGYHPNEAGDCVICDEPGTYCPDPGSRRVEACGSGFFCGVPGERVECGAWTQAGGGRGISFFNSKDRSGTWEGPGWDGYEAWGNRFGQPEQTLLPVKIGPGGICSCPLSCEGIDMIHDLFPECQLEPLYRGVPPTYKMP